MTHTHTHTVSKSEDVRLAGQDRDVEEVRDSCACGAWRSTVHDRGGQVTTGWVGGTADAAALDLTRRLRSHALAAEGERSGE